MLRAPIKSFRVCISHQSDHRIRVWISHQSERRFCLRGVQISTKIWGIRGERFVNWNHLLEWETLAFLCFLTSIIPQWKWSSVYCSAIMVIVPPRRKWVENFWIKYRLKCWWVASSILIEKFFNGKLCCKIHYLLSVPIIFFWIGLLGAISRWMSD